MASAEGGSVPSDMGFVWGGMSPLQQTVVKNLSGANLFQTVGESKDDNDDCRWRSARYRKYV